MKANELQIDDFIIVNGIVHKVCAITKHEIGYHKLELHFGECQMYYTRLYEVEPIPLTPEILEKSGFELTKNGNFYKLIDSNFDWSVEISNNDNRNGYVSGDGNVVKKLNYVHELQHCLRLCGLTELADNFKI